MSAGTSRRKQQPTTTTAPSARNVVRGVAVSLDGYIARLDGSVDWLTMDATIDLGAYTESFDVIVRRRETLDVEHAGGGGGGPWGKMACYIFSRSRPPGQRGGAEYVNQAPREFVRELKALPGKDIWLMGGGERAREFLKEDLIDRMDLGLMPVLLGEGIPLFLAGFSQRNFTGVSHKADPRGMVLASYARSTLMFAQTT